MSKFSSFLNKKIIMILWFLLVFLTGFPGKVKAKGASLSVFPQTGSFTVGSTFEVSIFMNTGENNINVVEANLKFNPEKLQVVTPTKGISIIGEWIFPPSFSNSQGTVSLIGGFPGEGINTSEGLITVIVFEAISSGETTVDFLDSSKILVGGREGDNLLTSINRGNFGLLLSPPKGVQIFSETHPDQNTWYRNNSPSFYWDKTEGTIGYSYQLDDDPFGEPDNNINIETSSVSFENIEDGIQNFHLKAKKQDIWGGTSHYRIMIDRSPPLEFKPYLEPLTLASGNYVLIYFDTDDLLSGIDHFKIRTADITKPQNIIFSGWSRQESPFQFTTERKGNFEIIVRAFDKAGNFQEGKIKIRVIASSLILLEKGIQIKGFFVRWWQIFALIVIVLITIGFLVLTWKRKKREDTRIRLHKEIKEAEKEIEDVKKAREKLQRLISMEEKASGEWSRLKQVLDKEIKG